MTLSQNHSLEFEEAVHSDTDTIIVKGRCGTSERVSGKPINGRISTACELAKRNAARQLLPYAELKAVEKKAQLEAEFDWQKSKSESTQRFEEREIMFSKTLREIRQKRNWRQKEVAEMTGFKLQSISRYEIDLRKPCWDFVVALVEKGKVDPRELFQAG